MTMLLLAMLMKSLGLYLGVIAFTLIAATFLYILYLGLVMIVTPDEVTVNRHFIP